MRIGLLLVAIFLAFPTISEAQVRTPQLYIALGDSLAAGQTPYKEIDTGYTDLIALRLKQEGQLSFYTKQLAFPGFTIDDVLERVQSEEVRELLSSATLITISAGANDLLSLVEVNPNAGTLSYSQLSVDFSLNNVRKKMKVLLEELESRAPYAAVYVMGYYFAFPYVHDTQKQGTMAQLELLNAILQQEAQRAGATFVSVYEEFGLDARTLISNPTDVHPNMEGYRVMANAFLREYIGSDAWAISSAELPTPNPVTFEELLKKQAEVTSKPKEISKERKDVLEKYVLRFGYERKLIEKASEGQFV